MLSTFKTRPILQPKERAGSTAERTPGLAWIPRSQGEQGCGCRGSTHTTQLTGRVQVFETGGGSLGGFWLFWGWCRPAFPLQFMKSELMNQGHTGVLQLVRQAAGSCWMPGRAGAVGYMHLQGVPAPGTSLGSPVWR